MSQYDLLARAYDMLWPPSPELATAYRRYAGLHGDVLDIGCGTGSLTELLRVKSLVALDASSEMLRVAGERLTDARLIHGRVPDVVLHERFDDVICTFDVMNHVAEAQWPAVLEWIRAHLQPSGTFAFDVHCPHKMAFLAASRALTISEGYQVQVERESESSYAWRLSGVDKEVRIRQYVPGMDRIRQWCEYTFSLVESFAINDPDTGQDEGRILFRCKP